MIAAIFVGGRASRFGGIAKGLLPAPDGSGSIVERLLRLAREHGLEPVLVGRREEYASLGAPILEDSGSDLGPLGGLLSLYAFAGDRRVLVLACDMPLVSSASIERLRNIDAPLAAARRDGRWEPFLSMHDPRIVAPVAKRFAAEGQRRLQAYFDIVPAIEVAIPPAELDDWDSPDDVTHQARTMPIRTMS